MTYHRLKTILCVILFSTTVLTVFPQIPGKGQAEEIINEILQELPENTNLAELHDLLENLVKNPVSLNNGTVEEFKQLFFLNDLQITEIISYRRRYNGFKSVYELKALESLDQKTLFHLLPFVDASSNPDLKTQIADLLRFTDHQLIMKSENTLENIAGYSVPDSLKTAGNYFTGSPQKIYSRYVLSSKKNLSLGFLTEKDAGEPLFSKANKYGFDFYSGHFYYSGKGILHTLAMGDYHLNFGQGLIMQTGYSIGKSPDVFGIVKNLTGIQPYKSATESKFMRGIASTIRIKKYYFTGFLSYLKCDASLTSDSNFDYISSISETGLHRTENEILKKNNMDVTTAGFRIARSFTKLEGGINICFTQFDPPIQPSSKPYQFYNFSGKRIINLSTDYKYVWKNYLAFGEIATDLDAFALLTGLIINEDGNFNAGILYRNYQTDFDSYYANPFREGGEAKNESGCYLTLTFLPFKQLKISAYNDFFNFPWLKYRVDFPSNGTESLVKLEYFPDYNFNCQLIVRYSEKLENSVEEVILSGLVPVRKLDIRLENKYTVNRKISLKTRITYAWYQKEPNPFEEGIAISQDLNWDTKFKGLEITSRYAVFNTSSYYSRVYLFEPDVLTSLSIPSFQGNGIRFYILAKKKISRHADLQFKVSRTLYFDRETISTGVSEISKPHKTEVKFLLHIKL